MTEAIGDRLRLAADAAAAFMRQEAEAVGAAADRLDGAQLARAVELLAGCSGTVATTGAGTSGIVARKIAATLTSTGTPAVFVHPADALHGGLGVIGTQQVVIAISNSGETEEVSALLPYLRSREVPVIAIVGNPRSTLGRQAAAVLEARAEREADPHDIVPTASVAVALSIGDALALTVMGMKGVTPEGFAANHPSGRLGRRLTLRVCDVMHAAGDEFGASVDTSLLDAVGLITRGGDGAVPIVDSERRLLGIITDGDVRRTLQRCEPAHLGELRASDIMTASPVVVAVDAMAHEALRLMEDRPSQISVLPVVDGDRCVGIIRLHDLVRIGL
jgi:arabinose-5-phosphate isomerase